MTAKRTTTLRVDVVHNDDVEVDDLIAALDSLIANATGTDGVLEEVGDPEVGSLTTCGPAQGTTLPPTAPYVDRICKSSANYLRTTIALALVDYAKAAMSQCNPTKGLVEACEWYAENARLARLIHSGGDVGRNAIAADGGRRGLAALARCKPGMGPATGGDF